MSKVQREYRTNIFLSFYWVLSGSALLYILFFIVVFILNIFNFFADKAGKEENNEQRYAINLKDYKKDQPRKIVDNERANNKKPNKTDLLSNQNSQSVAPDAKVSEGGKPKIKDSDSENIEFKKNEKTTSKEQSVTKEEFVEESVFKQKKSLTDLAKKEEKKSADDGQKGASERTIFESKSSSNLADIAGADISLSTYAWQWKPYIDKIKEKMYQFWSVPPAYFLGLINGKTYAQIRISRSGKLLKFQLLGHYGHKSLQQSSEDVLHAIFNLPKLPPDFPDEYLDLTIQLNYPGLRRRN